MKWLNGSTVFTILVLWTVAMLMGVDLAEANRTSGGRRTAVQSARTRTRSRTRGAGRAAGRGNRRGSRRKGAGRRGGRRGRGRLSRFERYGCEEIHLPMCKGLVPYTHTKLPNRFNHTTQAQVFRELERLSIYIDQSCSRNLRLLACSTYLPKCHGRRPGQSPCKRTCQTAKRKCSAILEQLFSLDWDQEFSCEGLTNRRCVRPMRDQRCRNEYPACVSNQPISACQNLTFTYGVLPNMFGQCHTQDINNELRFYESLQATNCHPQLNFMLCGVHSPYCIHSDEPFTFPCREICQEVRDACEADYRRLNHNLPWPHKLQCHRYPASDDTQRSCVMPTDPVTYTGN
ncbi:frizzled-5 [Plakobranchus ocellatus]|uniref:Frizzled-5 n=1 Tax=Plakobranchus ocellatus TaxID=259542 RepID=A0AAV3YDX6_9GAST|nr:frizzled-5 [Plakobranchus ocellatus]